MTKFVPKFMVFDYETALLTGEASTEAYRRDFRVTSCAFSWLDVNGQIKSIFLIGEAETEKMLYKVAAAKIPLVAHNIQYELLVTMCRFPKVMPDLVWGTDTMRLVQNFDNGGKFDTSAEGFLSIEEDLERMQAEADGEEWEAESKAPPMGMGLDAAIKRILPRKFHGHKKEAYDWIRANTSCGKRTRPGKFLNLLPMDLMKRYNIGDTENTLRLYCHITEYFKKIGFDYRNDHALFMGSVYAITKAKIRGVRVDRERLAKVKADIEAEVAEIEATFMEYFKKEIAEVEQMREDKWCGELKTEKGREKRRARLAADKLTATDVPDKKKNKWDEHVRFNVGSNHQLRMIFVDILKMVPKFLTDKGSPSFKSPALPQWGEGGMLLGKRRKRLLVLKQATNLLILSGYDGRFHLDLKACGTSTGRYAGGTYGG